MFENLLVAKGGCYNNSDHEQRFHDAGFVDIKRMKISVIGDLKVTTALILDGN